MQMTSNAFTKNIRLFLIVFSAAVLILGCISYAKGQQLQTTSEKVAEVQDQVAANNVQIDTTTAATMGGIALGGIAVAREYMNSKKLKKADEETDRDWGLSYLYVYRLIQTMDAKIPAIRDCLDQPFNSDPMMKDITIRRKLAEDAQSTANYLMVNLNTVVPSMTPAASVIVADAANTQKQAAPAQQLESSQQAKPAATTTTNPTVGK